jgi:hypothetical protein
MKPGVFKRIIQIGLILLSSTAIIYYISKLSSKEWLDMGNEKKFSIAILLGLFSWILLDNLMKFKTGKTKNSEEK